MAALKETQCWTEIESVCEFMRFVNIDDDPEPSDLEIRYSAWGDKALRVPHRRHPLVSVTQEPSIVLSLYSSFTSRNGNDVLWYPESKFLLLGKRITREFLADMKVPGKS